MTRNAAAGADLIDFNIGTATFTIIPATNLPPITDPVTIDGATQPGFAGVPLIEISGTSSTNRNVISSNNQQGVHIGGTNSFGNQILGNIIGLGVTGSNALANSQNGVFVGSGTNNTIRGNSIFLNAGLGIDLAVNGVTANDPGDADGVANDSQNFPVLSSATNTPTETTISGTLNSRASATYSIDFYSNVAADPTGLGESQVYLGSTNVTTDGGGNVSFTAVLPIPTLTGRFITALATDPFGNTSEFSTNIVAVSTVSGVTYTVTTTIDSGAGSLREAIHLANASINSGNTIAFNIGGAGVQVIQPTTALPFVSDPVTIDGTTQPGASCATSATNFDGTILIRLLGTGLPAGTDGLRFKLGGNTVRGLQIARFAGANSDGLEFTNGTLQLVNVTPGGVPGDGGSFLQSSLLNSSMAPDERYVVFQSTAGDLVANDHNDGEQDIFVRDLVAGTTTLISVNCDGTGSADGSGITFTSYAHDLVHLDLNDTDDVFVWNSATVPVGSVNLVLDKSTATSTFMECEVFAYTISITNVGTAAATGVTLTDVLPGGASFASASTTQSSLTNSGGTVTAALGSLGFGGDARVTINVTATAGVISAQADAAPANKLDSAVVLILPMTSPSLSITTSNSQFILAWPATARPASRSRRGRTWSRRFSGAR